MTNQPLYPPINPHFFQPLLPGFTNHLDIPVVFFLKHLARSIKCKTAELRSDASEITWKVKMDGRRLSDGWEDFTVAHELRVGDIVVFRHEGELVFHVSALGPSCCEIQYEASDSYEEDKMEKLCDTKEVPRKKSRKIEVESSPDHSCFVIAVTDSNLKRDIVYLPKTFAMSNGLMKKFEIVLMNEEGETWKIELRHEANSGRFNMRRGWRSFCVANGKKSGDLFTFKLVRNEETPVLQLLPLNSEDLQKLEPSNGTKQGLEATEKEVLGGEANRNDSRKRKRFKARKKDYLPLAEPTKDDIKQEKCSEDIGEKYVSTESNSKEVNISTSQKLEHAPQLRPLHSEDLEKLEKVPTKKSREKVADSSPDHSCVLVAVTASNLKRDTVYLPKWFAMSNGLMKKFEIVLMNEEGESWKIASRQEAYLGRFYMSRGWRSFCVANGKKPGDLFNFKLVQNEETPVLQSYPLNSQDLHKLENDTKQGLEATKKEFLGVEAKRNDSRQGNCFKASQKEYLSSVKPTKDDIKQEKAIGEEYVSKKSNSKEVNSSTSQNQFVTLTLPPTNFKTRLNLPLEFTKRNGINKAGKITMVDRYGARWSTSLLINKNIYRGTMSLGRNWKGFCEVNGVKMDESFLLELVWEDAIPVLKFCSKC